MPPDHADPPWWHYLLGGYFIGIGVERTLPGAGGMPGYFWITTGLALIFVVFAIYDRRGEEP